MALEQVNNYDLELSDLQMPEMDCYQATASIRALSGRKYSDLPVIILTASAKPGICDLAFAAGMNDYVSKSFKPDELYAKLALY